MPADLILVLSFFISLYLSIYLSSSFSSREFHLDFPCRDFVEFSPRKNGLDRRDRGALDSMNPAERRSLPGSGIISGKFRAHRVAG